jgi:hypothetical protein
MKKSLEKGIFLHDYRLKIDSLFESLMMDGNSKKVVIGLTKELGQTMRIYARLREILVEDK